MSIPFSHSPAEVIQHLLVDLGVVSLGSLPTLATWPCFSYNEVAAPDSAVFVIGTTGILQARIQFDGQLIERHGISLTVRSPDPLAGEVKARVIDTALLEQVLDRIVVCLAEGGTPHTYLVHSLGRTSGIFSLGKEPTSDRRLWTVNYLAVIVVKS